MYTFYKVRGCTFVLIIKKVGTMTKSNGNEYLGTNRCKHSIVAAQRNRLRKNNPAVQMGIREMIWDCLDSPFSLENTFLLSDHFCSAKFKTIFRNLNSTTLA